MNPALRSIEKTDVYSVMEILNYHHLLYFWMVAREGTIAAACKRLGVAQPTVSGQLRLLEAALGHRLFERSGRTLALTETGRMVLRYADEIFALGAELTDTVRGRPSGAPGRLVVGVADVLPKLIVHRMLQPALDGAQPVRIVCVEGRLDQLLSRLAIHEIDVVLADTAVPPHVGVRAFCHKLGESGTTLFASREIVGRCRRNAPRSLEGMPFLLPSPGTVSRRLLDQWFEEHAIRPRIVAECDDSALMKTFGQTGAGIFPAPTAIEHEVREQYGVAVLMRLPRLSEQFFAISMERKVRHPAVQRITHEARLRLFGPPRQ